MALPPDDPLATPVVGADAADDADEVVPPGIDGPAAGECFALW